MTIDSVTDVEVGIRVVMVGLIEWMVCYTKNAVVAEYRMNSEQKCCLLIGKLL